ncbi:OmpA family protein [Roseomonas sp. HF4]|uniref:OmpA family protein n=1 Tax=Roseomonas sp. HF4 TaxID=2562313 RepID=UPI002729C09F|nr:OmpA family protein [Roseomonas sp. HF4]
MKRTLLASAAFAIATATGGDASAQAVQGLYVGAGAGITWLSQTNASVFPPDSANLSTPSDHFQRKWEVGFAGVLSVGYGLGFGLRGELEGFYRTSEAASGLAFNRGATSGTANTYGLMANILYDIPLGGLAPAVIPYIGAGLGYAWTDWSDVGGRAGTAGIDLDGSDGTWAFQGILGLAVPIASVPGLAVTAEYRYFGTFDNPEISGRVSDAATGAGRGVNVPVATSSHSALLGVRYNYGRSAAPVAAAAVAPAPARTFLVFFDWNRADLTARARQIIGEAAQARSRQQVTRIEVNGHTDTSGSARYNQGLSERRAAAVAAELVRLGVPRGEIVTRGFGQSQLLVATPDNVREPQNRRVEIVLR